MSAQTILPKSNDMQTIELLYHCLAPTIITFDDYDLNSMELDRLESAVADPKSADEFFDAYDSLVKIRDRVKRQFDSPTKIVVLKRLSEIIKESSIKICNNCHYGIVNGSCNNPNAEDCRFCKGGLLL